MRILAFPVPARNQLWVVLGACLATLGLARASENVLLTGVPDYTWDAGCFGTASGNLMGYWDRHGFPDFYTGPTAGGVAPLSDVGNIGIRSLWASRAGLDGRAATNFGHMDDYWVNYESTAADPYLAAGRREHAPDCIGDFIGLNQKKWTNLNGECDGNIDGFSFVFWDPAGGQAFHRAAVSNLVASVPDIPSGLVAWTRSRGYEADAYSQLADFNPTVPGGKGFTFQDLKAEIDAGYPVLLFLQRPEEWSRELPGMPLANPNMHGMLAYGYYIPDSGEQYVRYKTSWGSSGENTMSKWGSQIWQAELPLRGVIGYHPRPRITRVTQTAEALKVEWEGPASVLSNLVTRTSAPASRYLLERTGQLNPPEFVRIGGPTTDHAVTIENCCPGEEGFYRLVVLSGNQE